MNDAQTELKPEASGPSADTAKNNERESILTFISSLKRNKAFEPIKSSVRVTPHGLFIEGKALDDVVAHYQRWLSEETHGEVSKSLEKCRLRLLDTRDPVKQHLREGKLLMEGFLAPVKVPSPQQLGLPYYLGSLQSAKNYLNPADPLFAGLNLLVRNTPQGECYTVTLKDRTCTIPPKILNEFRRLVQSSRFLERRYPGITDNTSISLRALTKIAGSSRIVKRDAPVLVPWRYKNFREGTIRMYRKFLIAEERGELKAIFELHGRNLAEFIRNELASGSKSVFGSFRLAPPQKKELGTYIIKGRRIAVDPRAFTEFVEAISRTKDSRERFKKSFSAQDCFERFSASFQSAQLLPREKLAATLREHKVNAAECRVYGGWLFVISKSGLLHKVIARHVRS